MDVCLSFKCKNLILFPFFCVSKDTWSHCFIINSSFFTLINCAAVIFLVRGQLDRRHWMFPLLRLHDIIVNISIYHLCSPSSLMLCLDEFGGYLPFSYVSSSVPTIYIHFSCPFKKLVMSVISCLLIKQIFSLKCSWFTVLD